MSQTKTIKIGEYFDSYEEFEQTLECFNKETFKNFVTRTSNQMLLCN